MYLVKGILCVFGFLFVLITLNFLAFRYIAEQKNHSFIVVVSILNCLTGILGILLGVFAIIELLKVEVKALYEDAEDNPSRIAIQTANEGN
ncbi:MAG: hypothetical protein ACJAU0_002279 [Flavobacteriales bacterium]